MGKIRLAMAQINPTVGDLEGNTEKILDYIERARTLGADVVTFPELALTGYPPEDLLLRPSFVRANLQCLKSLIRHTKGITAVVGFADGQPRRGEKVYNAAAIIDDGRLAGIYHKIHLPNYGVFDEKRYFQPGDSYPVFQLFGTRIGVNICEDIWVEDGPSKVQAIWGGAEIIINISSSPYHMGKQKIRRRLIKDRAREGLVILAYNNIVGGQDELVFDGGSIVVNESGKLIALGKEFEEDLIVVDLDTSDLLRKRERDPGFRRLSRARDPRKSSIRIVELRADRAKGEKPPIPKRDEVKDLDGVAEVYNALVLGTRDYVRKNCFQKVVIGLSGGIDSSLTAAIAVDALGPENVIGVSMPSMFSSGETQADARRVAENLGIKFYVVPIHDIFDAYLETLKGPFAGYKPDVTEENLQARIRGNILMAFSNKFGWLVLTTGNKSETSVGYCTLYGDTAGGFAVIKDVPKTLVYKLAQYRNARDDKAVIPRSVIERPPTAELRPNQKDEDSIPPYAILDPILQAYVEEDKSFKEIVAMGYDPEVVKRVVQLVDRNEYKRRQAPPGIKITPRAFGKDRRFPITNRYRDVNMR